MEPADYPAPAPMATHFQARREPRDTAWKVAFAAFWGACLVGGIAATLTRNAAYGDGPTSTTPGDCPANALGYTGRLLLDTLQASGETLQASPAETISFWLMLWLFVVWLVVVALIQALFAVLGASLVGAAVLFLAKVNPQAMAKAALALTVVGTLLALPLLPAIPRWILLALAAALALAFWWFHDQVELACHMLGLAAHGLIANKRLMVAAAVLSLVVAVFGAVAVAPILGGWHEAAHQHGHWAPNPKANPTTCGATGEPCCLWRRSLWVVPFQALLWVTMAWTLLLIYQVRAYVTSGSIGQWYFAPSQGSEELQVAAIRSLKHALGPSLGSLIFSAAVFIPTRLFQLLPIRALGSPLSLAFGGTAAVRLLFGIKYAVAMASLSGESLLDAGRHASELLARNGLDLFVSPTWVAAWVVALPFGALWLTYFVLVRRVLGTTWRGSSVWEMGAVNLYTTYFLANMLLSALDACYVCWGLDRDVGAEPGHPEFQEVFQGMVLRPGAQGVWYEQGGNEEGGLLHQGRAAPDEWQERLLSPAAAVEQGIPLSPAGQHGSQ